MESSLRWSATWGSLKIAKQDAFIHRGIDVLLLTYRMESEFTSLLVTTTSTARALYVDNYSGLLRLLNIFRYIESGLNW